MTTGSRRAEFFALEANEYLADLAPLAAMRERPDAERLVRGARALRGAALMAGLGTYARAAAGLEAIARQVRDHALAWEPNARTAWIDGLDTLRTLVTRAPAWEAADDRQALQLAEQFEQVLQGRTGRAAVAPPATLTPGVRAFIARESALIAGSLEQASRALAPVPPAAALAAVLERMQSLRGLGASGELSPLPELLDAMEVATRTLLADMPPPPNVAAVFADAAHAMSAMAHTVADAGHLTPPPELESIARRLLEAYATETDVVPIAALAPEGMESVVRTGTAPSQLPSDDPVPVELVSVGDHLLAVGDTLARPASPAARDLRLFVLHRTLAAMPSRSATGRFLAPLAEAITAAIGHRVATQRPEAFVAMLRGCGRFLIDAGGMTDRQALANRRDAIAASLVMIGLGAPAGGFELPLTREPRDSGVTIATREEAPRRPAAALPEPTPLAAPVSQTAPEDPIVPIESLAPVDDVVEIASLAPEDAEDDVVAIASLAPEDDEGDVVAIASLAPEDGEDDVVAIASLAPEDDEGDVVAIGALAPDDDERDVIAIASLAPDDDELDVVAIATLAPAPLPEIPAEAPGSPSRLELAYRRQARAATPEDATLSGLIGAEIVSIAGLLYRGPAALARAGDVRVEIQAILDGPVASLDVLRPFIDELLDLVPMARDAA